MALIPFSNPDGSPNEAAAFVNAVLCAALYHVDKVPFLTYAAYAGGRVVDFDSDKSTFQPDRGVIIAGNEALVILDGTTNSAQWVEHCASALFPFLDGQVPLMNGGRPFAVGSFLTGLAIIEDNLHLDLDGIGTGAVRIAGHSYGAACGHIFARHLASSIPRPSRVEVMTFGEPMAFDGRPAVSEPDYHARLVATLEGHIIKASDYQVDPVSLMPTGCMQMFQFLGLVKWLKPLLSLSWAPYGDCWKINSSQIAFAPPQPIGIAVIPFIGAAQIWGNLPLSLQHLMDQSYLPKVTALWQRSGKEPGLSFLLPYVALYTGNPFQPADITGPPVSATVLNQSFFDRSTAPVTDADRPLWETITAVGGFFPIGGGASSMTLMKGSLLCGIMNQGFSESFHSSNPGDTYLSMQTKLGSVLPSRMALSNGVNDPPPKQPNNQMSVAAFRISDDLLTRDVLAVPVTTPIGWNGSTGNLDGQLAAKINWRAANGQQIAVTYLHGVPNGGLTGALGNTDRTQAWGGTYITAVQTYCNVVAAQGLGFNTINNNPVNALGPITAVVYNAVSGYYTLTTTNPVPQGKFRVALRAFKSLRFLNGRQSAQAVAANQFVVFKKAASATWDNSGTAVPLSGYNNGVPFSNYIVAVPATATPSIITTRKLGRPFFLQHGRVTRRAA